MKIKYLLAALGGGIVVASASTIPINMTATYFQNNRCKSMACTSVESLLEDNVNVNNIIPMINGWDVKPSDDKVGWICYIICDKPKHEPSSQSGS